MNNRKLWKKNIYVDCGDHMEIHIKRKEEIIVGRFDKEDFSKVDLFTWHAHVTPSNNTPYICSTINDREDKFTRIRLHRMLMGEPSKSLAVDHINRDTLDNRKSNLRVIPLKANSQNKGVRSDSSSGIRGVRWYPSSGHWLADVTINGKRTQTYFKDKKDAENAAIEARAKYMPYSQDALL